MMDSRGLLTNLMSNWPTQSPLVFTKQSYASLSCCFNSFVGSQNQVSFHTYQSFLSQRVGFIKRLECRNSVERSVNFIKGDSKKRPVIQKKLAIFVSGRGSNFRSIYEACLLGSINGEIVALVTDKPACGGAEYARNKGIRVILCPLDNDEPGRMSSVNLVSALRKLGVDFILLAGYLKLIPADLIQSYPRSILNIHPSLLPAFGGKGYYGMKVHRSVISSGARYSGCTIHFVNEDYDGGRILAQRIVPVLPNDTPDDLAARVLCSEHRLYVDVAAALCDERIIWREDGVPLIQNKENPQLYI